MGTLKDWRRLTAASLLAGLGGAVLGGVASHLTGSERSTAFELRVAHLNPSLVSAAKHLSSRDPDARAHAADVLRDGGREGVRVVFEVASAAGPVDSNTEDAWLDFLRSGGRATPRVLTSGLSDGDRAQRGYVIRHWYLLDRKVLREDGTLDQVIDALEDELHEDRDTHNYALRALEYLSE